MRCPKIPLLPILPGLFPAHEWTAVLTSSRFDVNARIVVYRCRCLFVCMYVYCSPIQRHFQKQRGKKKKASRGGDAAEKKNESRQLQTSKRKTKTEKLLKRHASNRIPSLSETNNTRKGAITGEEAKKTNSSDNCNALVSLLPTTPKACVVRGKWKKRTGRGERRETTETLFPRIIKQKSKK